MNVLEVNSLVLAYLGDSIYENYVRLYLVKNGINHVKDLQEKSLEFVSAKSQSRILRELINKQIFTEEELEVIKRARNAKPKTHPKNTDIITYKYATGFEALIGYLYINDKSRLDNIMKMILR